VACSCCCCSSGAVTTIIRILQVAAENAVASVWTLTDKLLGRRLSPDNSCKSHQAHDFTCSVNACEHTIPLSDLASCIATPSQQLL
jgi:hypothetical protein